MEVFLTASGVCVVFSIIAGLILKYWVNKSLERLDVIPNHEQRITVLEKDIDSKKTDFKTLEHELRNTSERLIRVETLLETLIKKME